MWFVSLAYLLANTETDTWTSTTTTLNPILFIMFMYKHATTYSIMYFWVKSPSFSEFQMHSVHAGKSYIRNARERKGMIRGAAVARARFARTHTNRKSNKGKMLNRTHSHTKKGRVAGINKPSSSHITYVHTYMYVYTQFYSIFFYFYIHCNVHKRYI